MNLFFRLDCGTNCIAKRFVGGKQVPGRWVCGKLNGSEAVVKFSLRPGSASGQALAVRL